MNKRLEEALQELKEIIEKEEFVREDFSGLRATEAHRYEIYIKKLDICRWNLYT